MVPIGIGLSLLAAMLLNQGLKGTVFFRTFFFLPSLTPIVAATLIWRWLYHPNSAASITCCRWSASTGRAGWATRTRPCPR